jgi:hypothetical protein
MREFLTSDVYIVCFVLFVLGLQINSQKACHRVCSAANVGSNLSGLYQISSFISFVAIHAKYFSKCSADVDASSMCALPSIAQKHNFQP